MEARNFETPNEHNQSILKINNVYKASTLSTALRSGLFTDHFITPVTDTFYFEGNELACIGCEELKIFASYLEEYKIRKLYLGHNSMGLLTKDKITTLFSRFSYTKLQELYIDNNVLYGLGTENFQLLLNYLRHSSINVLDLSENYLINLGLKSLTALKECLPHTSIQTLNIFANGYEMLLPKHFLQKLMANFIQKTGTKPTKNKEVFLQKMAYLVVAETELQFPTDSIKAYCPDSCNDRLDHFVQKIKKWIIVNAELLKINYQLKKIAHNKSNFDPNITKLKIAPIFEELQKILAKNSLRQANRYSLKELAIFTIHHHAISWEKENLPKELKEEIETCCLKI